MRPKIRVLIAGIGGASLGTEILKCLLLTKDRYTIFGCDISPLAFGHYQEGFKQTFLVNRKVYLDSVLEICQRTRIHCIIPGGEEPLVLLSEAVEQLKREGICLASNSPMITACFSNKKTTFEVLAKLGIKIPLTWVVEKLDELDAMSYPCIIKPITGSGGSSFVFLAADKEEASLYVRHFTRNGKRALVQEYIPADEGEFTVGVLSLPNKQLVGSIALKRVFNSKLSIFLKGKVGLISSGYSQGLIDEFPEIRSTAEQIATAVESQGPLNIQGRVRNGVMLPFEINPRFSASTYLRALAGFNEIDMYLRYVFFGEEPIAPSIRPGYYLRSLSEVYVSKDSIQQ